MTDDVFQKHVTALAVKRLEKPKKMSTQNAKYWSEIGNQLYNFHRGICVCLSSLFFVSLCICLMLCCPMWALGRNTPLIQFLTLALYMLLACIYGMLPHLSYFLHFFLTYLLPY